MKSEALIVFHGRARADEIAVTIGVINASDSGPEFGDAKIGKRIGSVFARVGVFPFIDEEHILGVRSVFEKVGGFGMFAVDDVLDFVANANESVDEAIEFVFGFRFGGFNHEGASDREGEGGGVEGVVHETFGDVFSFDAVGLEGTQVEDEFVSDEAVWAGVEDIVVRREAFGHVIGVENGGGGGLAQPGAAHEFDVHVGNGQDGTRTEEIGRAHV